MIDFDKKPPKNVLVNNPVIFTIVSDTNQYIRYTVKISQGLAEVIVFDGLILPYQSNSSLFYASVNIAEILQSHLLDQIVHTPQFRYSWVMNFVNGFSVIFENESNEILTYSGKYYPGGISKRLMRSLAEKEREIFEWRLLNTKKQFFLTTRTFENDIYLYEKELAPLYFIGSSRIYRFCIDDGNYSYEVALFDTIPGEAWYVDLEKIYKLSEQYYGYLAPFIRAYIDDVLISTIHILPSPLVPNIHVIKFLNSYGVYEKIVVTGVIKSEPDITDNSFMRYDPETDDYLEKNNRLALREVMRAECGYKTTDEFLFLRDMLQSASQFLICPDETAYEVRVTADNFSTRLYPVKPESVALKLRVVESDTNHTGPLTEEILWKPNPVLKVDSSIAPTITLFNLQGKTIDWGDGHEDVSTTNSIMHTYSAIGLFDISISDFNAVPTQFIQDQTNVIAVTLSFAPTTFPQRCFYGCAGIAEFNTNINKFVGLDLSQLVSIDTEAFMGAFATGSGIGFDLKGNSVFTSLGYRAFLNSKLNKFIMNANFIYATETIGEFGAQFEGCNELQVLHLGGITNIAGKLCYNCSAIGSLSGAADFQINIAHVTSIGREAFSGAFAPGSRIVFDLTGNNVFNYLGYNAFQSSKLNKFIMSTNAVYTAAFQGEFGSQFNGCNELQVLHLGGITNIAGGLCYNCSAIGSLSGAADFQINITHVTSIGREAFRGAFAPGSGIVFDLTGNNVFNYLGYNAFRDSKLNKFIMSTNAVYTTAFLGEFGSQFDGCSELQVLHLGRITDIAGGLCYNCSAIGSLSGAADFQIDITHVTSIGREAFRGAFAPGSGIVFDLTGNNVFNYLGHNAFRSSKLNKFIMDGYAVYATESASGSGGNFAMCTEIVHADVGTIDAFRQEIFGGDVNLMLIVVKNAVPPLLAANALNNVPSNCIIKVPSGSVGAYQSASGWSSRSAYIQAI